MRPAANKPKGSSASPYARFKRTTLPPDACDTLVEGTPSALPPSGWLSSTSMRALTATPPPGA
jgi:hypothetical protein